MSEPNFEILAEQNSMLQIEIFIKFAPKSFDFIKIFFFWLENTKKVQFFQRRRGWLLLVVLHVPEEEADGGDLV